MSHREISGTEVPGIRNGNNLRGRIGSAATFALILIANAALLTMINVSQWIPVWFLSGALVLGVLASALFARLDAAIRTATNWLGNRMALVHRVSLPVEVRRINLLRMGFGAVYTVRQIFTGSLYLFILPHETNPVAVGAALVISIVCGVLITVGLFTPVAIAFLFVGASITFDSTLSTGTLGTVCLHMALIALLLMGTGTSLSIDARLMRRTDRLGSATRGALRGFWRADSGWHHGGEGRGGPELRHALHVFCPYPHR